MAMWYLLFCPTHFTTSQVHLRVFLPLKVFTKFILGYHESIAQKFDNLHPSPNFSVVCHPPMCRSLIQCYIQGSQALVFQHRFFHLFHIFFMSLVLSNFCISQTLVPILLTQLFMCITLKKYHATYFSIFQVHCLNQYHMNTCFSSWDPHQLWN